MNVKSPSRGAPAPAGRRRMTGRTGDAAEHEVEEHVWVPSARRGLPACDMVTKGGDASTSRSTRAAAGVKDADMLRILPRGTSSRPRLYPGYDRDKPDYA